MAIKMKAQYRLTFQDNTTKSVVAADMIAVAKAYETDPTNRIAQAAVERYNVETVYEDPPNPVTFATSVTPSPAAPTAGCKAYPSGFTVEAGSEVVFEAVVGAGYDFTGWYVNGVQVSTALKDALVIPAPQISGQTVPVEARFVASS